MEDSTEIACAKNDVSVSNGQILPTKPFCHKPLEERVADFGGKLNPDGEFDWGQPEGREVW